MQKQRIQAEDLLKSFFKLSLGQPMNLADISHALHVRESKLRRMMRGLIRHRLIEQPEQESFQLTEDGKMHANHLVRAHRLWESYLVQEMGMNIEHIHEEAEQYEHILTTDQVDDVDKQLGYPALDPHGSPIPGREPLPHITLDHLNPADHGRFTQRQPGAEITYMLWDLGLGPGDHFEVTSKEDVIRIRVRGDDISLPVELARSVRVEKTEA